jgi:hypothetical protein
VLEWAPPSARRWAWLWAPPWGLPWGPVGKGIQARSDQLSSIINWCDALLGPTIVDSKVGAAVGSSVGAAVGAWTIGHD